MRCGICSHAKRGAIESALTTQSVADVATRFGVSESALQRHQNDSHQRAAAHDTAPAPPPAKAVQGRRRAPTPPAAPAPPVDEERGPETVRSQRTDTTARERAQQIVQTIEKLLSEAAGVDRDGDGSERPRASYAEKASLVRAAISANRQLAQLRGELGVSDASLLASPTVQALLADILAALKSHPAAAKAVLEVIERRASRSPEVAA